MEEPKTKTQEKKSHRGFCAIIGLALTNLLLKIGFIVQTIFSKSGQFDFCRKKFIFK